MKNLLIYISKTGSFDNPRHDLKNDAGVLIKVQIDNSLAIGWHKKDILLITNFPYQYKGIKAICRDVAFFDRKPQASKINAIVNLFEEGMIKDNELYFFHDLDAYQLLPITEMEIDTGDGDIAITDYGIIPRWSTGVIFFRKGSRDIFEKIKHTIYKYNTNEELALGILTNRSPDIANRIKKLNKSYNFTPPNVKYINKSVSWPLKIAHFHIEGGNGRFEVLNPVSFFKGENAMGNRLITQKLIDVFDSHGIS